MWLRMLSQGDLFQDHDQLRYSMLKFPYDIVSFLMPVWAILYVFRATSKPSIYNDDSTEVLVSCSLLVRMLYGSQVLQSFYSSRASSISSIADVVVVRNWRRRYRPLTQVIFVFFTLFDFQNSLVQSLCFICSVTPYNFFSLENCLFYPFFYSL